MGIDILLLLLTPNYSKKFVPNHTGQLKIFPKCQAIVDDIETGVLVV
ncbi:hypothetical protein CAL7102_09846 [Dulcicalothrix desertica PCC 7102]|nr:hypothetical protein CAL7102_09846 [Dulcicalothrix desertica PCC 7102]